MKKFEILKKGNSNTLLTITPDRVTIKLKNGSTEEYEDRVTTFFKRVAREMENTKYSLRGTLQESEEKFWISLRDNQRKTSQTFLEDE